MLVVHIGAGNHLRSRDLEYKKLLQNALRSTTHNAAAIALEEPPLTNTGCGSSLNMDGKVECDASIIQANMNKRQIEVSVAAHNIQHKTPTLALWGGMDALKRDYSTKYGFWGLSAPVVFDYGAIASRFGLEIDSQTELVHGLKRTVFELYRDRIEILGSRDDWEEDLGKNQEKDVEEDQKAQESTKVHSVHLPYSVVQDTIGIIHATDEHLTVLSSSGGNFFKLPGRIGCAGIVGAAAAVRFFGLWCISCLCSGNGDDIVQMNLAATIAGRFKDPDTFGFLLVSYIEEAAFSLPLQAQDSHGNSIIYVGVLCVLHNISTGETRLVYSHSTESFYFGYMGDKPHTVLSRSRAGVFVQGEYKIGRAR